MSHKLAKLVYLAILCLLSCILFSMSQAAAQGRTTIPLKEWYEYTKEEKVILRNRWTDEKINAVVKALKERRGMPEFITRLDSLNKDSELASCDLRGINLQHHELNRIVLASTYLQGADLSHSELQDTDLKRANLQGANLRYAKLQGANLRGANLERTILSTADLQDVNLSHANLKDAVLIEANLESADLDYTDVQGAELHKANLQDASLYRVSFDSTYLWRVNLGVARDIKYIQWGDTLFNRYVIGEEVLIDSIDNYISYLEVTIDSLKSMKESPEINIDSLKEYINSYTKKKADILNNRKIVIKIAEITYRDLKTLYKKELMDDVAAEFHFRENEVRTKSYAWYQPARLLRLILLKWTYGYGSRPTWLLWYSLVVIGGFAFIYAILTILRKTKSGIYLVKAGDDEKEELLPFSKGRLFINCLYFSTLSFATFGYGAIKPKQWLQFFRLEPVEYKPVRWARIFVGIEAALGIWIFALLVTVLFGK